MYILIDAVTIQTKANKVILSCKRNGEVVKSYVYDNIKFHKGDELSFSLSGFVPVEAILVDESEGR